MHYEYLHVYRLAYTDAYHDYIFDYIFCITNNFPIFTVISSQNLLYNTVDLVIFVKF